MAREPLPTQPQYCTSRELKGFLWRAIREKNKPELRRVARMMKDRGQRPDDRTYRAALRADPKIKFR